MQLATNLEIKASDYANQGNSIIGIRDSGKTYTAMKIAECLLDEEIPIIVFDPTGVWQNLRYGTNGSPGYPVVVAGGLKSDLELTKENIIPLLSAALQANVSLIIDLNGPETGTKSSWVTIVARAVEYLMAENHKYGLRHVFIEEAAEFIPQRPSPNGAVVYGQIERMARIGRNFGLGYTLINQRPEEIAKAVFEISELVLVHRQAGKNSLNSLKNWLDVRQASNKEIIKTLPSLLNGECWVISNTLEMRIKVSPKRTFHPNPKDKNQSLPGVAVTDVSDFVEQMRGLMMREKAEKLSPAKNIQSDNLELTELERLKKLVDLQRLNIIDQKGVIAVLNKRLDSIAALANSGEKIGQGLGFKMAAATFEPVDKEPGGTLIASGKSGIDAFRQTPIPEYAKQLTENSKENGQTRMLKAAAMFHGSPRGDTISRERMAIMTGINPKGSTFSIYMRNLKNAGHITETGKGEYQITHDGLRVAGKVSPLPSGSALLHMWCRIVGDNSGKAKILRHLFDTNSPTSRTELAGAVGINPSGSTFSIYVRELKNLRLILQNGSSYVIAPEFN